VVVVVVLLLLLLVLVLLVLLLLLLLLLLVVVVVVLLLLVLLLLSTFTTVQYMVTQTHSYTHHGVIHGQYEGQGDRPEDLPTQVAWDLERIHRLMRLVLTVHRLVGGVEGLLLVPLHELVLLDGAILVLVQVGDESLDYVIRDLRSETARSSQYTWERVEGSWCWLLGAYRLPLEVGRCVGASVGASVGWFVVR
jgi:hypothetical protein